jgi:hypothetical protein
MRDIEYDFYARIYGPVYELSDLPVLLSTAWTESLPGSSFIKSIYTFARARRVVKTIR